MAKILLVEGSLNPTSTTAAMLRAAESKLKETGAGTEFLDLRETSLPLFIPGKSADRGPNFEAIQKKVMDADAFLLGTPDYHGGPSGTMKNFLDFFWREFTGKLFGYICASHEKGLTAMDQLRTSVRQCYGWSMPYGVSGIEGKEVDPQGKIVSEKLDQRLTMLAHDMKVYTDLLAKQRQADIDGDAPSFLAILRNH